MKASKEILLTTAALGFAVALTLTPVSAQMSGEQPPSAGSKMQGGGESGTEMTPGGGGEGGMEMSPGGEGEMEGDLPSEGGAGIQREDVPTQGQRQEEGEEGASGSAERRMQDDSESDSDRAQRREEGESESDSDAAEQRQEEESESGTAEQRRESESESRSAEEQDQQKEEDDSGATTRRETEESESDSQAKVELDQEQKTEIKQYFTEHKTVIEGAPRVKKSAISVSVGVAVPQYVELVPLPEVIVVEVPSSCPLLYFIWDDDLVIVDRCTRRVVEVITDIL